VVDRNGEVESNPELINSDPYGAGWLVVIEGAEGGLGELLDAEAYRAFIEDA
jgi:glycine cleavage system H protein